MSGETYAIVFKGEIVDGFAADAVKAQLSRLLKADAKKAVALFSGKQIVLKKTTDKAEAAKYGKALKKVGADVKIRIIRDDAAAPKKVPAPKNEAPAPVFQKAEPPTFQKADTTQAPPKPDTKEAAEPQEPVIDTSGISLAPLEGNLYDPEPETREESPEIDLSGFSIAENDDTPLENPSEEVVFDVDLSDLSVKDNDGTALVEQSDKPAPKVDAPDFGLDEPGAVLETLQEEKELLNPSTAGITLAMAGTELLEDEPPPPPPPSAPDTSKINLVPNFDT